MLRFLPLTGLVAVLLLPWPVSAQKTTTDKSTTKPTTTTPSTKPTTTALPTALASSTDLTGNYINTSNQGQCQIRQRFTTILFINERGTQAQFGYVAPGQLRMISGGWNPAIVVTVSKQQDGKTLFRFQEPNKPVGYWVSAN